MKVVLARKVLKKDGQLDMVKLLPRLVSKGRGRTELVAGTRVEGVGVEVGAEVESKEVVWDESAVLELTGGVMEDDSGVKVEVEMNGVDFVSVEEAAAEDTSNGPPPCRACNLQSACGSGRRSTRISPLLAYCANSEFLWY